MHWLSILFCLTLIAPASRAGDSFEQLLSQGSAQLRQGQYTLALESLRSARQAAGTAERQAQADGALGLVHYQTHHYETADRLLQQAVQQGNGEAKDRARWQAALADLKFDRRQIEEARQLYSAALNSAGDDPALLVGIHLGQAALFPPEQRLAELGLIAETLNSITQPAERARYRINLAGQVAQLGAPGLKLAYENYEQARAEAKAPRLLAEALGGLAQLYENQKRPAESLRLNQQGIQAAQSAEARDLLLDLEWRQGRLQRAVGHAPEAIAAYQRAVDHIEAIRPDIPVEYHNGKSSFRETLEPVYLGLADLLLEQAKAQTGESQAALLRRARETVELIKQTELEDFLGGRCAVQSTKSALLESVEPQTAILYPILLPERVEVLASVGTELRQFTQPVSAQTVQTTVRKMARNLRQAKPGWEADAKALYDWLIAPAAPWLKQHQIQTLVIVPDGVLRLIPLAAIHDGEHYLVENYAVATSPGLTLFEPAPLQQHGIKSLLAGMSEPGSVVEHLPPAFLQAMAAADAGSARGVDLNGIKSRALPISVDEVDAEGERAAETNRQVAAEILREPAFFQRLKDQLALPGVKQEMDSLKSTVPNTLLMNESFTKEGFKQHVVEEPYSVVHIASHGVFGKSADTSFIMAYDGVINIDELEELLKSEKFKKQPVELLTLSACQTAEGDDRAPLGISGVAIKAKVRSALGTLWPVSDDAAWRLMTEFYKALSQPGVSKVQALRQAQVSLIKQNTFKHPFYWSPFILEPPREFRRLIGVSHAAMADSVSCR